MPARNLSDESVHDLADALRGLPQALEDLNERVNDAVTSSEIELRFEKQRLELEAKHKADLENLRAEQRKLRRNVVSVIAAVVLVGFLIMGFVLRSTRRSVQILSEATSPARQQVSADSIAVALARFDCAEEDNIQQQTNAMAALLGRPTVVVFHDDNNCQAALRAALDKLAADQAALKQGASAPPTTRPSSGPAAVPGTAGPKTSPSTTGPVTSATTQPPHNTTTTTTTTTTSPSPTTSPPTTTCTTVPPLGPVPTIGVCRLSEQRSHGLQEGSHSGKVRRA